MTWLFVLNFLLLVCGLLWKYPRHPEAPAVRGLLQRSLEVVVRCA